MWVQHPPPPSPVPPHPHPQSQPYGDTTLLHTSSPQLLPPATTMCPMAGPQQPPGPPQAPPRPTAPLAEGLSQCVGGLLSARSPGAEVGWGWQPPGWAGG